MPKLYLQNKGFTIIEIMVTISIAAIIIFISADYLATGFKTTMFESEQEKAIVNARKATEVLAKEIRGANISEQGDYAIFLAEDQDLIYYSDIDDDGETEKIRYFLGQVEKRDNFFSPWNLRNIF